MKSRTKAFLWVFGVFLGGALFGSTLTYYVGPVREPGRTDPPRLDVVKVLKERLQLREDQVPQLQAILQVARQRYKALGQEADQEFQQARSETRGKIRAILDAEQKKRYEEFVLELDKRHKERPPHWHGRGEPNKK